ncbi:hypothetical protein Rsw2DRAFT_0469 [Rhodobacter ferrooxidans]|uniref:Uncharacterized protein n=2 Tax=Rhodobacter ferrooxidans TaxID=371731 RepID=C8RXE1_9RHOB|nr:hypothetical protein Rsw2DRAFT_0469 [Rhodobacter sp. SW2]
MEPKFATKIIRDRWDRNVAGTYVSTTFWRMWKGNLLHKDEGSSVYRLPEKKEPADMLPGEASTGSLFNTQAKGREAVPGGGT